MERVAPISSLRLISPPLDVMVSCLGGAGSNSLLGRSEGTGSNFFSRST